MPLPHVLSAGEPCGAALRAVPLGFDTERGRPRIRQRPSSSDSDELQAVLPSEFRARRRVGVEHELTGYGLGPVVEQVAQSTAKPSEA